MIFRGIVRFVGTFAMLGMAPVVVRLVPDETATWPQIVFGMIILSATGMAARGVKYIVQGMRGEPLHSVAAAAPMRAMGIARLAKEESDTHPDDVYSLARTARHEAAHAVAVIALGHELVKVSTQIGFTVEDGFSGNLGHTAWRHPNAPSIDLVTVSLIGNMAQELPSDHRLTGGDIDDYEAAMRASITAAIASGSTPSTILDGAMLRARALLEEHAAEIDLLAAALAAKPTTLTGQQALDILKDTAMMQNRDDGPYELDAYELDDPKHPDYADSIIDRADDMRDEIR